MALFICCVSSPFSDMHNLANDPLSLERRLPHRVASHTLGPRARYTKMDCDGHKGETMGLLPLPYWRSMLIKPPSNADEMRCELGTSKAFCPAKLDKNHQTHEDCNSQSSNAEIRLGEETDHSIYAWLLRQCTISKALSEGKRVHDLLSRCGYADNIFLSNLLVQMYSKCGCLENARAVFDQIVHRDLYSWNIMIAACAQNGCLDEARALFAKMPQRDVVSWNAMLTGCAQNGNGEEALQLFGQMQAEGFKPNKVTFICVVDACARVAALEEGRVIHAIVVGDALDSDVVVDNALMNMYGKCRSLADAQALFSEMTLWNVVSWSAMIAACAQNGHSKEALQFFVQMHAEGFEPNKVTFICVVDACASVAALEDGRMIHATITGNEWESDLLVGTALVNMYGKCMSLDDARAVFAEISQRNLVCWSAMITAYAQNEYGKEALQVFDAMHAEGCEPNKITFIVVVEACAIVGDLEQGRVIHATVAGNGWELDVVVGNALVSMYGKRGGLDDAKAVFAEMPQRDVVSWSAMIAVSAQDGRGQEALQLFGEMQAEGFKLDNVILICVLDACASVAALEEGLAIHAIVAGNGVESDVVGNALVSMYSKCGSLDDARAVFAEISLRDVASWNAIITTCAQNGHGMEALQLCSQMQAEGFEPNKITFTCIVDVCAGVPALEKGHVINASVAGNGWESDLVVGTALLNMYGKCATLEDARAVFLGMLHRDVVCWNAMMAVSAQNGHCKEALQLFDQMQAEGFEPDKITFICVLSACSHTGLVNDGRQYFFSMNKDHGITPLVEHYVCMIDLLGRKGLLEEAEDLIISMPFKDVPSAWLGLLSSCRIHGDVERAVRAANFVIELDPRTISPYVLLSNIHANADRYDCIVKARKAIVDSNVKKAARPIA